MNKIAELQNKRGLVVDKLKALSVTADGRDFTTDEQAQYDAAKREIASYDSQIRRATELLAFEVANARTVDNHSEGDKKDMNKYSFLRAIKQSIGGKLSGIEAEMDQEARTEAKAFGRDIVQGFSVPSYMMKMGNKRDMTAGTGTAGGYAVQTNVGQLIPYLYPKLWAIELGATTFSGLKGNLDIPVNDAIGTAAWEGENDANAEVSPTMDRIQLTPNRLGATTDVSNQLILQSESLDVEMYVRRNLEKIIAIALDKAAINGSGSGEPTGILNTSGIGSVVGGTNGAVPDWADIVDLQTAVAVDDADMGKLAYLTTPGIRGKLKQTEKASGTAQFVWGESSMAVNGYRAEVSTQVPSTLTKGTSSGVCHAIIFGNWEELIVAQWGGINVIVDPYSKKTTNLLEITANSWWDIGVKHASSFAAMKDALLS